MITERAERLHDLVNGYKDAAGAAAEAQKLSNVLGALQESVSALDRSLPVVLALKERLVLDRDPALSTATQLVSEARAATTESPRAWVDTKACEALLKTLKAAADDVQNLAIQGWQSFCSSNQREVPSDLLNALAVVDEFHDTAVRAQEAADKLTSTIGASGPIPTKEQVEAAAKARDDLALALDAIKESVPASIEASLRACMSRDGLPLGDLSDDFRDWMRKYKVEKSFILRIR